ncbi:MAG: hypothetical protein U0264_00135 [Candidatus Kapaibacterium sp.]
MATLCKKILSSALSLLFFFVISCTKTAPLRIKQPPSTYRTDWHNSYKNYTNSLEDAAEYMPGDDGGAIGMRIAEKSQQLVNYQKLKAYIDTISTLNSCIVRMFNENMYFTTFNVSKKKIPFDGKKYHLFVEGVEYPMGYVDTSDCVWFVKNADNVLHCIYLSSNGEVQDEKLPYDNALETSLHTMQRWKKSRQVSIPYEKKYGTIVSYWDKGNSYHVFFPWMWNAADCENGWKCATKDTSVNNLHSAIMKFLCMAKQKGIVESQ